MIYIFVRGLDPCGEGERAQLYTFSSYEEANKFWASSLADDEPIMDIIEMQMIDGSHLQAYHVDTDVDKIEREFIVDGL